MKDCCLLLLGVALLAGTVSVAARDPYTLRIGQRAFTPDTGIDEGFEAEVRASDRQRIFGIIQLWDSPPDETVERLERIGIRLNQFLGRTAYVAEFASTVNVEDIDRLLADVIRWVGDYPYKDKLAPGLLMGRYERWSLLPDDEIKLIVQFHRHVSHEESVRVLQRFVNKPHRFGQGRQYAVVLDIGSIPAIADEELVFRIRQGPHPAELN